MKRGRPLHRRIGLRTNAPLRAKKPIERSGAAVPGKSTVNPIKRSPMKPYRPAAKTQEEIDAREAVETRSDGMCEAAIPGACQGRAREFQHRQAKGQLGAWTASNGLAVCGHGNVDGCHGYIHQNPTEATRNGWTVKSWDDPLTHPVLYRGQRMLLDNQGGKQPAPKKREVA